MLIAGDYINRLGPTYYGQPVDGLTGGKVWPRVPRSGVAIDQQYATSFLNGVVPEGIQLAQNWYAIAVRLQPLIFGFSTSGGTNDTTITTAGGVKAIRYGKATLEYNPASTRTTSSTSTRTSDATQALITNIEIYVRPYLLPDATTGLSPTETIETGAYFGQLYAAGAG